MRSFQEDVKMRIGWEKIYPVGSVRKVLRNIVDPLDNAQLPQGTFVSVKKISSRNGLTWIECLGPKNSIWKIRPRDLELLKNGGPRGRYRIALRNKIG
jgi:hypothetical protein